MNAAGTSRSPLGPRRSISAPTSTAAGSCQLGPLVPSPPTTTVRGAAGSSMSDSSSSSTSSAPRSLNRSLSRLSPPNTSTGSVGYVSSRPIDPAKCSAAAWSSSSDGARTTTSSFRYAFGGSSQTDPGVTGSAGSAAASPCGSSTSPSITTSGCSGSPKISAICSSWPVSCHASSSSTSGGADCGVETSGMEISATGSSVRTDTCSSDGVTAAGSSGSSQSTSRIGAKNLSRSSNSSSPFFSSGIGLDLHQFLLLVTLDLVDVGHEPVGQLLQVLLRPLQGILRDVAVVLKLLELILRVPPNVADRHAPVLGPRMDLFDELPPAFLGERREREPDDVAVVVRRDPEVARLDRLLDRRDGALVEGLHLQQPRLRHVDARELVQRDGRAVVLDLDAVEDRWGGASGTDPGEVVLQVGDGLIHLVLRVAHRALDRHGRSFNGSSFRSAPRSRRGGCCLRRGG